MTRFSFLCLTALTGLLSITPLRAEQPLSPAQALINQMGQDPWRYGGAAPNGQNHLVIGLRRNGEHGIAGEYALLDQQTRALRYGTISGTFDMPSATGGSVRCLMTVRLPDRILSLSGTCSPNTVSGSISTRRTPSELSAQVNNFLSPDTSTGEYWLTASGFSEAFQPRTMTAGQI